MTTLAQAASAYRDAQREMRELEELERIQDAAADRTRRALYRAGDRCRELRDALLDAAQRGTP